MAIIIMNGRVYQGDSIVVKDGKIIVDGIEKEPPSGMKIRGSGIKVDDGSQKDNESDSHEK